MSQLRNPRHNFGYINLPEDIQVHYQDDKEGICWSPHTLIEREIHKSEVDVMFKIRDVGGMHYLGKATEIRTSFNQRYLKIDTTNCVDVDFGILRSFIEENRPVYQYRPYLVSMHVDMFIKDISIVASTVISEVSGVATDSVLNMVIINLG